MTASSNGSSPMSSSPEKIIRATQRKMMSRAVVRTWPGYQRTSSRRPLRPAERGERVERRREPRVEDVLVLPQLGGAALGARSRLGLGDRDVAVGAVPDRDAVSPPDLARDTPVADVLHPVEVDARKALGREADVAILDRRDRGPGELLHRHPPLRHDERLDAAVAAHAVADGVAVVLALLEQAVLGRPV